ncbi:hypothetical protein MPS_3420 [Mycobacterium pseudoshottsii JCM 15466]|uniref:Uncharacterized protein n=1 Tax=Mycobacterium ulcerans str. Harvey TaxID=1299332 RepID=A0ABN0QZ54_MYCUL|nr:hypothetical protein I551_3414 [Mycobacterium ulcerans str. Harvey]GAQ37022.1 hypothetical protein MPS_3420 [Mycobacterium pseudoshottsii JCM 15466]
MKTIAQQAHSDTGAATRSRAGRVDDNTVKPLRTPAIYQVD